MQEASCVSFIIGSLSFGEMSVLKPKATVKAGAVPLIQTQFRRGRMEAKALRLPETRRPCLCAMPGHTMRDFSVSSLVLGKPCLHSSFFLLRHAGSGMRLPLLLSFLW